jgi:hypothetical protein
LRFLCTVAFLDGAHRSKRLGAVKSELFECDDDLLARVERDVRGDAVLALAQVDGAVDVGATECLLGPEAIVGAAADAEVFGFAAAAEGVGDDVVELEKCGRFAAVAVGGDVRAAASVSLEDEAAGGGGDVS